MQKGIPVKGCLLYTKILRTYKCYCFANVAITATPFVGVG